MKEAYNLEEVYDDQIQPLMTQIINVCKKHDLPFVATFQFASDGEDDHQMCSSASLPKVRATATELEEMYCILIGKRRSPSLNLTVRNAEGQVTAIERILP